MSTTVTYKGATLTTAENQTRVLETAGKLMEDDLTITDVTSGGGGVGENDVNFIDYDGTIVASYSASDFLVMDTMPENPSHDGLVAQGWNWSLTDAQSYVQDYGKLVVGQMYVTASGDTEIDIELHKGRLSPTLGICPNGTVEIDWGDGSAKDTVTGSSLSMIKNTVHTYASDGSYTITLRIISGSFAIAGNSSYGSRLLWGGITTANSSNKTYQNSVQAIRMGGVTTRISTYAFYNCHSLSSVTIPNGVTSISTSAFYGCYALTSVTIPSSVTSISASAFYICYSLSSVTIPSSVTSIGSSAFSGCHSLSSVTIPNGVTNIGGAFSSCYALTSVTIPSSVTSIGSSAFYSCYSLSSVTIPSNVTNIGTSVFQNCYSLTSVTIPDGVTSDLSYFFRDCHSLSSMTIPSSITSIGGYAFYNCYSLSFLRFTSTTPPTASNANWYANIPADCVIYVPSGSLSAYSSATNYPDPATYSYVEEQ